MHPSSGQRNKFWGAESNDALLELSASSSIVSCSSTSGVAPSTRLNLIGAKFTSELLSVVLETRDGTSSLSGTSNFLQGMNLPGPML